MSAIAASCGDEYADPGDIDPALEWVAARAALILGVRRGKLAVEVLCRRGKSDSGRKMEAPVEIWGATSVRM